MAGEGDETDSRDGIRVVLENLPRAERNMWHGIGSIVDTFKPSGPPV